MGGLVLVPAVIISTLLWAWLNQYIISLIIIILSFSIIGGIDDFAKVLQKRRILKGLEEKKSYSDKADGVSGTFRLLFELLTAFLVIGGLFWLSQGIDGHLHIPGIPEKWFFPELGYALFIPFAVFIIVGGANAVNLTDGLDTLASVPIITCSIFVVAAAYISGDADWAEKLKIAYISADLKEVVIFAITLIATAVAFLKFNSPPASIYMGDIGSLGLGAALCTMFVFVKAELYLPLIGWPFVWAALSTIMQRLWFKIALKRKGREWASKHRLFFRAPYHHHMQALIHYRETPHEVESVWHNLMVKFGMKEIPDEDKYLTREQVNNKVIWSSHLRSITFLVITMIIFFKVR